MRRIGLRWAGSRRERAEATRVGYVPRTVNNPLTFFPESPFPEKYHYYSNKEQCADGFCFCEMQLNICVVSKTTSPLWIN